MSSHWFKQCPVCQYILKNNSSKGKCILDVKKPVMVLPAATTTCVFKKKVARDEISDSGNDEIESCEESDTEMDVISESDSSIIDDDNDDLIPTDILRSACKTLSPPVPEEDVLGKWYALIYATKWARPLYVGKILKCFLLKENCDVDCLEVHCLKPRVGSGTLLEDTHLMFPFLN